MTDAPLVACSFIPSHFFPRHSLFLFFSYPRFLFFWQLVATCYATYISLIVLSRVISNFVYRSSSSSSYSSSSSLYLLFLLPSLSLQTILSFSSLYRFNKRPIILPSLLRYACSPPFFLLPFFFFLLPPLKFIQSFRFLFSNRFFLFFFSLLSLSLFFSFPSKLNLLTAFP